MTRTPRRGQRTTGGAAAVPFLAALACAAGAVALTLPAPCRAQTNAPAENPPGPDWRATAGVFVPVDLPSGTRDGVGYTVALARAIPWRATGPDRFLAGVRYTEYGLKGDVDIRLYSPTIEYERFLTGSAASGTGLVAGLGAGMVFGDSSDGGTTRHFAYSVALGYSARALHAEARLLRGGNDGEHGVAFSLGANF